MPGLVGAGAVACDFSRESSSSRLLTPTKRTNFNVFLSKSTH